MSDKPAGYGSALRTVRGQTAVSGCRRLPEPWPSTQGGLACPSPSASSTWWQCQAKVRFAGLRQCLSSSRGAGHASAPASQEAEPVQALQPLRHALGADQPVRIPSAWAGLDVALLRRRSHGELGLAAL